MPLIFLFENSCCAFLMFHPCGFFRLSGFEDNDFSWVSLCNEDFGISDPSYFHSISVCEALIEITVLCSN